MPTQVMNDSNSANTEIKVKTAYNGEIMITYINENISYDELCNEIRGICRFPPDQVIFNSFKLFKFILYWKTTKNIVKILFCHLSIGSFRSIEPLKSLLQTKKTNYSIYKNCTYKCNSISCLNTFCSSLYKEFLCQSKWKFALNEAHKAKKEFQFNWIWSKVLISLVLSLAEVVFIVKCSKGATEMDKYCVRLCISFRFVVSFEFAFHLLLPILSHSDVIRLQ